MHILYRIMLCQYNESLVRRHLGGHGVSRVARLNVCMLGEEYLVSSSQWILML